MNKTNKTKVDVLFEVVGSNEGKPIVDVSKGKVVRNQNVVEFGKGKEAKNINQAVNMLIKIPVKELLEKFDVESEVLNILKNDSDNAYTIKGLTSIVFNGHETPDMKNYHKVRSALMKLVAKNLVKTGKSEQRMVFYYRK